MLRQYYIHSQRTIACNYHTVNGLVLVGYQFSYTFYMSMHSLNIDIICRRMRQSDVVLPLNSTVMEGNPRNVKPGLMTRDGLVVMQTFSLTFTFTLSHCHLIIFVIKQVSLYYRFLSSYPHAKGYIGTLLCFYLPYEQDRLNHCMPLHQTC